MAPTSSSWAPASPGSPQPARLVAAGRDVGRARGTRPRRRPHRGRRHRRRQVDRARRAVGRPDAGPDVRADRRARPRDGPDVQRRRHRDSPSAAAPAGWAPQGRGAAAQPVRDRRPRPGAAPVRAGSPDRLDLDRAVARPGGARELDGQTFGTWIRRNLRTPQGRAYFALVTARRCSRPSLTDISLLHAALLHPLRHRHGHADGRRPRRPAGPDRRRLRARSAEPHGRRSSATGCALGAPVRRDRPGRPTASRSPPATAERRPAAA